MIAPVEGIFLWLIWGVVLLIVGAILRLGFSWAGVPIDNRIQTLVAVLGLLIWLVLGWRLVLVPML